MIYNNPSNYIATNIDTSKGIVPIKQLNNEELKRAAQIAWNVNDGDTLRGCRAEAKLRGIKVA